MLEERRAYKWVVEVESEWGVREREGKWSRGKKKKKKMRKTETNKRQEREKINIIINGQGIVILHKV